jgi:dolichol kinase
VQKLIIEPTVIVNRDHPVAAGGSIPDTAPVHTQISFSGEIIRKTIHLGSLSIPVLYYYVTRDIALKILVPFTIFSLIIDIGRHYVPAIQKLVSVAFDRILRPHERKAGLLSGATYVLISALFCVFVFPKLITITAFAILIVSDSASALIGRAFGKHRFLDKSLEGTTAFVLSAWLVVLITPKAGPLPIEYIIAAIAAIIGGVFEAASATLRFDDNFAVPVSIGFVMWGGYLLMARIDPAQYDALYHSMLGLL